MPLPRLRCRTSGHELVHEHRDQVAIGDRGMAKNGVQWCDFPVRCLDFKTLKSTKKTNQPEALSKRIVTFLRRLSIVDLSPVTLVHTATLPQDCLAQDVLDGYGMKLAERMRISKNKPLSMFGLSQHHFFRQVSCQLTQDSMPSTPASCIRNEKGLQDEQLAMLITHIGRAASRPIRFSLLIILISIVLFVSYGIGTTLYIIIYGAIKYAEKEVMSLESVSIFPPLELPTTTASAYSVRDRPDLNAIAGVMIINCLFWSIASFIVGVIMLENKRSDCYDIIKYECDVQNAQWRDEIDGDTTIVRQLHLILHTEVWVKETRELTGSVKMYAPKKMSLFNRLLHGIKCSYKDELLAIRYSEMPYESMKSYGRSRELVDVPSSTPVSLTKKSPKEMDDTDDFDSDNHDELHDDVVVMVPLAHSRMTAAIMFSSAGIQTTS